MSSPSLRAVFDGHNDTLIHAEHRLIAEGEMSGHLDLPRMREGGMRGGIFAIFTPKGARGEEVRVPRTDRVVEFAPGLPVEQEAAAGHATRVAGRLLALERAGHLRLARQASDLDAARADPNGPPVAVLHLEGAEAIDPELEALDAWYSLGLRSLGLVWSRPNEFGHGVPFISPSSPDTGPGLTSAGLTLVERCAQLGIMVDLSHLNEEGFWDVASLQVGPLVASHSGVHALSPCSRNLTDAQLDAIAASDGLVGIVFAVAFLRSDFEEEPDTPIQEIVRHVRYVAERIGPEHVAFGSDFDGTTIPSELGDVTGYPRLLDALREDGFSETELEQIAWSNWRRVLDAWWRG